ncbi:MAG: Ig-like domain-containing protein [Pirellulales bacterium]
MPTQSNYDNLGLDWIGTAEPFDDTAWAATPTAGPNGVGYHSSTTYAPYIGVNLQASMQGVSPTAFVRIPFTVADAARIDALTLKMRADDGFIAYLNGVEIQRVNATTDVYPAWNRGASGSVGVSAPNVTYDVSSHSNLLMEGPNVLAVRGFNLTAGNATFLVQAALDAGVEDAPPTANDDVATMSVEDPPVTINVLANDVPDTAAIDPTTVQVVGQPANGTVAVNPTTGAIMYTPNTGFRGTDTFTYRVRDTSTLPTPGGVTQLATVVSTTAAHRRLVPTAAVTTEWTGSGAFADATWLVGSGGVGYDTDAAVDYEPFFAGGVVTMQNVNPSVYVRYPFTITDPSSVVSLQLKMRWEDGFVAWINGVQVAAMGAPAAPAFDSISTSGARNEALAVTQDEFVIDLMFPGLVLKPGAAANILAIQGLNDAIGSSDLLVEPELIADVGTTGLWSNAATVTVSVTGIGPAAVDDAAETIGRTPVVIPVLDNDLPSEPPNDYPLRPETVRIVEPPANGTATVNPTTGSITYQASAGFSGEDTLQYTVRDAAPVGGESGPTLLLPRGSVWKYLSGPDQGTAWTGQTFNDSAWLSGPAEIGFGDGGEVTVVIPGGNGTHTTIYFRSTFDLTSAAAVQQLNLFVRYDDGMAVYINGQEVERQNLAAGATYADYAPSTLADDGTTYYPFVRMRSANELGMLVDGTNTIAVEVHQQGMTSSDMSFDLEVEVIQEPPTGRVSNPATVTIAVASTNEPPTAIDDEVLTKIEQPVDIDVLANDEPGGALIDAATVAIVDGPSNGTATVLAGGHVAYTPASAFVGDDSFTYTVTDLAGRMSNVATVAIHVVTSVPMPADDLYYVDEDDVLNVPTSFGLLHNDTDDGGELVSTDVAEPPQHGTLLLADDGSFQYVPAANFFGEDHFRYRATDNFGATVEAGVTIRVTASPDAPIALGDVFATPMGTPLIVVAAALGRQVVVPAGSEWRYLDDGANPSSSWRQPSYDDSAWSVGTAQFGYGDGDETTLVRYGSDFNNRRITTYFRREFDILDPTGVHAVQIGLLRDDGAAVYVNGTRVATSNLPASFSGTTVAETAVAGDEENAFLPFDINPAVLVAGRNVIAVEVHQASATSNDMSFDLYLHGDVAGPVTDGVLLNDVDPDGDFLTAALVSPPAHGTLEFSADGGFVYTPNAGFVGADAFTYRASDGTRQSAVATVVINVTPPASMAADLNEDGVVNEADVAMVVAGLGMSEGADKHAGDANGDGVVDIKDVVAVQQMLGQKTDLGAAAPAALVAGRRAAQATDAALAVSGLRPMVVRAARRPGSTGFRRGDSIALDATNIDRTLRSAANELATQAATRRELFTHRRVRLQ